MTPSDIQQPPAPLLLKACDAAVLLAISERKLWQMTNAGKIPCIRMGRAVRYSPDDLKEWIADQTR